MKPTIQPTLFPTIPFSSRWEQVIQTSKSALSSTVASQIFHSDLSWSGRQISGGCIEWSVLLRDTFPTASITLRPIALTLSGLDAAGLLNLNDKTANVTAVNLASHSSKCSTSETVESIIRALQMVFRSTSLSLPYQAVFPCQEINWSVVKCTIDALPVLCVNCANYCSKTDAERIALPLLVISCVDAVASPIGQLSTLSVEYAQLSPPPTILNFAPVPSSSSIKVTAQLSGPGSLICAAFLASIGYTPPSPDVLLSQGSPVIGAQSGTSIVAIYDLLNLVPSSSYQLFCATRSPTSSLLSPSMTSLSFVTACCRAITVRFRQLTLNDKDDSPLALTINIGVVPSAELIITLRVVNLANSSQVLDRRIFTPTSFTFLSSSSVVIAQSNYLRSPSGSYRLQASLSGASSSAYQLVYPLGDTFTVKNTETEPLSPQLLSAIFSDDGSKVVVTFVSSTNKGGAANVIRCSTIFSSRALDQSTRCIWIDSSKIEIFSTGNNGMRAGDRLWLLAGSLKSFCTSISDPTCSSWKSNTAQNLTVAVPPVAISPAITISVPSQLGPCDNLAIDLTASTGNGGRSWQSFSLQAESISPNITTLQKFLSQVLSITTPVVVPYTNLTAGYAYTLHVTLCNFLGSCSTRSTSFVVSSSTSVPIVSLNSQNVIKIYRCVLFSPSFPPPPPIPCLILPSLP
jgi:hypothetical protein